MSKYKSNGVELTIGFVVVENSKYKFKFGPDKQREKEEATVI